MPTESIEKLKKGTIVSSGIFPEKVEVIAVEEAGTNCTVLARGLESGHIYEKILNQSSVVTLLKKPFVKLFIPIGSHSPCTLRHLSPVFLLVFLKSLLMENYTDTLQRLNTYVETVILSRKMGLDFISRGS